MQTRRKRLSYVPEIASMSGLRLKKTLQEELLGLRVALRNLSG